MFDLSQLGFTKEELQERVLDRICEQVLTGRYFDYDDECGASTASHFGKELEKRIKVRIDESIDALAQKHVLPNVTSYMENLLIQTTNQWGEKRGEPVSFIEYLTQRAEAYMQEKVSHDGKSQAESGGYSWSGNQTRITYLVHKHLQYNIETAMKSALQIANSAIAQGIESTVKMKLEDIVKTLKVSATITK